MQTKKQQQVGETIKRSFGMVLLEQGVNIYRDALVSVTSVNMSSDLSLAKIYLSVYNSDNKLETLELIQREIRILKSELVRKIRRHVRRIPEIALYLDDTVDEIYRVNTLFDKLYEENQMGTEEE
jgi:ribosome-binding factor A